RSPEAVDADRLRSVRKETSRKAGVAAEKFAMRVAAQIPLAEATTRFRIRRIVDSGPWEQRRVQRHDLNQVVAGVLKDANEVEQLSVVAQSRLEQRQPQLPAMLSKLAYRRLELQSPCGRVLAVEEPRTLQGLGLGVRGVQ